MWNDFMVMLQALAIQEFLNLEKKENTFFPN